MLHPNVEVRRISEVSDGSRRYGSSADGRLLLVMFEGEVQIEVESNFSEESGVRLCGA